jgi:PTS system nitrogen regulatory IIA component
MAGRLLVAQLEDGMGISERISAADVILGLAANNKRQVLETLAAEASRRLGQPQAEILGALQDREALGSTALGRGVALPHARLAGSAPPLVLFARLRRPVDYEARDEEPVDLVILVLWPEAEADGFLPALAEICRALRAPQALRRLRTAASAEEVPAILERYAQTDGDPREDG